MAARMNWRPRRGDRGDIPAWALIFGMCEVLVAVVVTALVFRRMFTPDLLLFAEGIGGLIGVTALIGFHVDISGGPDPVLDRWSAFPPEMIRARAAAAVANTDTDRPFTMPLERVALAAAATFYRLEGEHGIKGYRQRRSARAPQLACACLNIIPLLSEAEAQHE